MQIPHHIFRLKLKGMCIRYGLTYLEQEESYTSKASFLDGDKIPIYNADNPTEYSFISCPLVSERVNQRVNIYRKFKLFRG